MVTIRACQIINETALNTDGPFPGSTTENIDVVISVSTFRQFQAPNLITGNFSSIQIYLYG